MDASCACFNWRCASRFGRHRIEHGTLVDRLSHQAQSLYRHFGATLVHRAVVSFLVRRTGGSGILKSTGFERREGPQAVRVSPLGLAGSAALFGMGALLLFLTTRAVIPA